MFLIIFDNFSILSTAAKAAYILIRRFIMLTKSKDFLTERKENDLKSKLKGISDLDAVQNITAEVNKKFDLKNWLMENSKKAGHLSITTHPSKFSHPDSKTTAIYANIKNVKNGYLCSGNVEVESDVLGSAAAMPVYKFLSLPVTENLTVLEAFETKNEQFKQQIELITQLDFETLRTDFLKIKTLETKEKTDRLIKQVYFPVPLDEKYHLLSILTPAGLIFEMKKRIDEMRFSTATQEARKAKRENKLGEEHHDLFDLTVIGYGGTKPQNISVLNSQNGGKAYLLSSCPPVFKKRTIRLPRKDFFQQFFFKDEKEFFQKLHRIMTTKSNNIGVRTKIEAMICDWIDALLSKAYKIRVTAEAGWTTQGTYQYLPLEQKIWLDEAYQKQREESSEWRDKISVQITRYFVQCYRKHNSEALLEDAEFIYVKNLVQEKLKQYKEFF